MLKWIKRNQAANSKPLKSKKNQARRKQSKETFQLEWNKRYTVLVTLVLLIFAITLLIPHEEILPIEKIDMRGEFKNFDSASVQQQLKPYLGTGFFSVDIAAIQDEIRQQPWIKTVSIRRVWPDALSVTLEEHRAFARWDDAHLISREAVIFQADTESFGQLPLINGYSGDRSKLLQRFAALKQQFKARDIELNIMREDRKGALSLLINQQLKVSLGSDNNEQKIKHLLSVYPQWIKPKTQHIQHIDFRYSNGFAIAWKKEYLQSKGQLVRGNKNV